MKALGLFVLSGLFSGNVFAFEGTVEVRNIRGSCAIGTVYPLNQVESVAVELAKAVATAEANGRCMYFGGAIRTSHFQVSCVQSYQTAKVTAVADFKCKPQY